MTLTRSHRTVHEGVAIHAEVIECSDSAAVPVVLLHGFTGSGVSMASLAERLGEVRTVVRVDLVGHGKSDAPDDLLEYRMHRCIGQLHGVIDDLELQRPHWIGYSMGGRVALSFGVAHAERVLSVLAIGGSAGLTDDVARQRRIREDEALADRILQIGLERFVDEWMAKPIFSSQVRLGASELNAARAQRLENRPDALALSLRGMGTGAMTPLDLSLAKIPICLVTGAEDEKFCGIARELATRCAEVRSSVVPDAGHAAHLENPDAFVTIAEAFFDSVERNANQVSA